MKTSTVDPIRVDYLSAGDLGLAGRIGMTIAPGKKDPARDWDRDLAADLDRLRKVERADVLVTLLVEDELRFLKIPDLLERARAAGLETIWFPIPDVDAPPRTAMPEFRALVERVLDAARAGRTVVIHCRGGVGRSGLLAACCLVGVGHEPLEAICLARRARRGAVEVEVQERWVKAFAGAVKSASPKPKPALPSLDTVRGCLLGGALGDALGYPVEFKAAAEIARTSGSAPPAKLALHAGRVAEISDDTQMTMFVAEGYIRAFLRGNTKGICDPVLVIRRALLRWYSTQGGSVTLPADQRGWLVGVQALHSRRAPGTTCLSALEKIARTADPGDVPRDSRPPNNSKGCGAVMRSAPIGLGAWSREVAFEHARDSAVLTHGHPSGYLSAAHLAATIWGVARGASLEAALDEADLLLAHEQGHEETAAIVARARKLAQCGTPGVKEIESLGGGWTGEEALAIAVLCALTFDPKQDDAVRRCLWRAVAHSGDSDSTGSITGNLVGAMVGARRLPESWLADLELREEIDRLARDLHASAIESSDLSFDDYPPV